MRVEIACVPKSKPELLEGVLKGANEVLNNVQNSGGDPITVDVQFRTVNVYVFLVWGSWVKGGGAEFDDPDLNWKSS